MVSKMLASHYPRYLRCIHGRPTKLRSPRCPPAFAIRQPLIRQASTGSEATTDARSLVTRLKNVALGTSIILVLSFGYLYITDTRSGIHRYLAVPSLRLLYPDAEEAHLAGTKILRALYNFGLHPRERGYQDEVAGDLHVEVFGHVLDNPIGTSAGLDKHAEIPSPLLALGPAIVEIGGTTPQPQAGNEKPRVFRISSQNALINRYGLNSEGAERIAMRLRQRVRQFAQSRGYGVDEDAEQAVLDGAAGVPPGSLVSGKLLAVQVAKNKGTPEGDIEAIKADYIYCVEKLAKYADIIVVNVSSPNTPGLRSLQSEEPLKNILTGVVYAAKTCTRRTKPAVMVKVSPDEDSDDQIQGICDAIFASGVDGVIVGNTTKRRPAAVPEGFVLPAEDLRVLQEQGGYSGPQLFERTVSLVKRYRQILDNQRANKTNLNSHPSHKVIFATGGITNGAQALEVLNAGASVAMVYTALVYGGVGTISAIKDEMRKEIGSPAAIG